MIRAWGTINALVRDGVLVYEAIYSPSYRHSARRIPGPNAPDSMHWATEAAAVTALELEAARDGLGITIQAGAYPRGTRKRGETIHVA